MIIVLMLSYCYRILCYSIACHMTYFGYYVWERAPENGVNELSSKNNYCVNFAWWQLVNLILIILFRSFFHLKSIQLT